jgi:hypothetical protein
MVSAKVGVGEREKKRERKKGRKKGGGEVRPNRFKQKELQKNNKKEPKEPLSSLLFPIPPADGGVVRHTYILQRISSVWWSVVTSVWQPPVPSTALSVMRCRREVLRERME